MSPPTLLPDVDLQYRLLPPALIPGPFLSPYPGGAQTLRASLSPGGFVQAGVLSTPTC